ncbi:MAG TPA: IPT/TIG domain-containing protein, partial [Acetobacteraceae bacterium]|nr:IPT/TIG domain-containing protein [Acetobacteraceae bacterium]
MRRRFVPADRTALCSRVDRSVPAPPGFFRPLGAVALLVMGVLLMAPGVAHAQAPTVASTSPGGSPAGATHSLQINGTNFTSPATVTVGGVSATSVTLTDSENIIAVTPALAAGDYDVVVTTTGGSGTAPIQYEFVVPPTITAAYVPASITTAGSSTLTLTINNPNKHFAFAGGAVSAAALPPGLTGSGAATTCNSGTATLSGGSLSLSGALLAAPNGTCTVTVSVSASTPNTYAAYTTGTVSGTNVSTYTGTTATTPTGLTVTAV